ncbi:probable protein phosphatase 2C 27, partial [Tanacetum coccineum]
TLLRLKHEDSFLQKILSGFQWHKSDRPNQDFGLGNKSLRPVANGKIDFLSVIRLGSYAQKGPKQYMDDEHICIANLLDLIDGTECLPSPRAFYGVFDGHGGTDAATYVRQNVVPT